MTAPSPELETAAEELARLFANARTHGNVYMDGSHNPLPSEDKAAERFVSNVRIEERARFADLVAACEGVSCDLHCGIAAEPDKVTYCFTCHERFPCTGEDIRQALTALEETP